jgi:hypothetical protein
MTVEDSISNRLRYQYITNKSYHKKIIPSFRFSLGQLLNELHTKTVKLYYDRKNGTQKTSYTSFQRHQY